MVAYPERSSPLTLLVLLLLARGERHLFRDLGPREYDRLLRGVLDDVSENFSSSDRFYTSDLSINQILSEVYRALNDPYPASYRGFRGEPMDETLSRFFDKTEEVDKRHREFERFVEHSIKRLEARVGKTEVSIDDIADKQLSTNWSLTLGAPFETNRTYRTAPVRFYSKQSLPNKVQSSLQDALFELLSEFGFEPDLDFPAENNSFWKRFWVRTKNIATHKEVEDRFLKLERALETAHIDKPQAEANKMNADSFSTIMDSLKDIDDACAQIGNILLVKNTPIGDGPSKARVVVRTLSPLEMHAIEQNQSLLKEPATIIQELESLCVGSRSNPAIDG